MAKYEFENLDDFCNALKLRNAKEVAFQIRRSSENVQVPKGDALVVGNKYSSGVVLTGCALHKSGIEDFLLFSKTLVEELIISDEKRSSEVKKQEEKGEKELLNELKSLVGDEMVLFRGRIL